MKRTYLIAIPEGTKQTATKRGRYQHMQRPPSQAKLAFVLRHPGRFSNTCPLPSRMLSQPRMGKVLLPS